jgi:hypothetical protein
MKKYRYKIKGKFASYRGDYFTMDGARRKIKKMNNDILKNDIEIRKLVNRERTGFISPRNSVRLFRLMLNNDRIKNELVRFRFYSSGDYVDYEDTDLGVSQGNDTRKAMKRGDLEFTGKEDFIDREYQV